MRGPSFLSREPVVLLLAGVSALALVTLRGPGCAHVVEEAEPPPGAVEATLRAAPPASGAVAKSNLDAHPKKSVFKARARPLAFARWSPDIAGRTLLSVLSPDVHIDPGREAEVDLWQRKLHITTGILEYDFAWEDVERVYARPTTDPDLPFVLCIQTTKVPLIVLADLDLGAETQAVAEAAMRHVNEARSSGG